MNPFRALLKWEAVENELLLSTARKVIFTTGAVYLVFHFIATLGWPQIFSPSLWTCTILLLATLLLTISLLERSFLAAQVVWFSGLTITIVTAYVLYQRSEVILLLTIFPMMAEVTLGLRAAIALELGLLILSAFWNRIFWLPALPPGYDLALALLSLCTTFLGWSFSDNLLSAIEASSYHYREALQRLEETRQHRAEISVLLNEVSKANYQLDRLNRMLNYARMKAEEAREERDRFAMSVSHELRSPLNFVIGFSDLMVNSPETYAPLDTWPSGLYQDIQEIYRSSTHLLGLINDILDMGKIDARQMPLFKERVEIGSIIEEVRKMTANAADKKGLEIKTDLAPGLPILYVDRTRIRQVLLNLITNSLRFTAKGSITVRASMITPELMHLEVEDTGTGIAQEDLDKIFNEFRQVGSQNWRRDEGSGLGLAIGRRFILMHGGEMSVDSELGHGSNFHFTLPVHSPNMLEIMAGEDLPELPPRARHAGDEKTPLLLFLSGDLFWAKTFAESLAGYKVTLLADPNQLLPVTRQSFPRAIIIDQAIADHEAVQAFLHDPPYELPVITFAIPVNLNRISSLPEGVCRYLLKPVSRYTLVETVRWLGAGVRTLLVVDDDPGMVRFVTQALRSVEEDETQTPEPRLLTAMTGTQALQYLQDENVDAILLDLDLPDINGLALIGHLQKDERLSQIPVVVLSANDLPQSLEMFHTGQFRVTMNRPFYHKELLDILSSVIRSVNPDYEVKQVAEK